MERLTIKAPSGLIHLKDNTEMTMNVAIKKLSDFEDLEEQNKLLKPPCALGDIVYRINIGKRIPIIGMVITEIRYKALRSGKIITKLIVSDYITVETNGCSVYYTDEIGKKIFLTIEEAEAALKELERGKGNETD